MFRKLLSVFALAAVATTAAQAQDAAAAIKPVTFGIKAGASVPVGSTGDGLKLGYIAGVQVGFNVPSLPVSFRVDADYANHSFKDADGNNRLISFTGSVVYEIPTASTIRPYALAGVGVHNAGGKFEGESLESETKFGFHGGAGVKIPLSGFNTFVEIRYNHIPVEGGSFKTLPIFFGVSF